MVTEGKVTKTMKSMLLSCFRRQGSTEEPSAPVKRTMVIVGDGECGKTCLVTRMATGQFVDVGYVPTVFETEVVEVHTGKKHVQLNINDTAGQEDYDRIRPFSYHNVDVVIACFSLADPDTLTNIQENWIPEVKYFCGDVPVILVGNKKDLREDQMGSRGTTPTGSSQSLNSQKDAVDSKNDPKDGEGDVKEGLIVAAEDINVDVSVQGAEKEEDLPRFVKGRPVFNAHAPVKHSEGVDVAQKVGAHAYFETSALTGDNVEELLQATCKAAVMGSKKSKKFKPFAKTLVSWRSVAKLAGN